MTDSSDWRVREWVVDDVSSGDRPRLDRYLADRLPGESRSAVQRLIADGQVEVDRQPARASQKVSAGQVVRVVFLPPKPAVLIPEDRPLDILYEDDDILVVNKPPGEVVHPSPGHREGTLVHAILAHCSGLAGVGGRLRPGIVHRLDRDTSGVLVVAKKEQALRNLQDQFKRRKVRKTYLALVEGRVAAPRGRIEAPVGRDPDHRKRMAVVRDGRPSVTRYQVLRYFPGCTLLGVRPVTGRTHQVRVHFAFLGHPVVGDTLYGRRERPVPCPRQFLHAWRLQFRHPSHGAPMGFRAPLPADLRSVLRALTKKRAGS